MNSGLRPLAAGLCCKSGKMTRRCLIAFATVYLALCGGIDFAWKTKKAFTYSGEGLMASRIICVKLMSKVDRSPPSERLYTPSATFKLSDEAGAVRLSCQLYNVSKSAHQRVLRRGCLTKKVDSRTVVQTCKSCHHIQDRNHRRLG